MNNWLLKKLTYGFSMSMVSIRFAMYYSDCQSRSEIQLQAQFELENMTRELLLQHYCVFEAIRLYVDELKFNLTFSSSYNLIIPMSSEQVTQAALRTDSLVSGHVVLFEQVSSKCSAVLYDIP